MVNPVAGYAGMMENLDNQIGHILELLKESDQLENTLIFFSSDNGAHLEGGHQPKFWDSNGPLRGHKRDLYEGGIRAPSMAYWPGTIDAGSHSDHPSAQYDFLATVCDLLQQPVPEQNTGISLLPTLTGQEEHKQHNYLYWEFYERGYSQAVRMGKYKGVRRSAGRPVELYDVTSDIGERNDIAAGNPGLVKKVLDAFEEAHTPSPHWKARVPKKKTRPKKTEKK